MEPEIISRTFSTKKDMAIGIAPIVAYCNIVQAPVRPPLDMLFGIMKLTQARQYSSVPKVRTT